MAPFGKKKTEPPEIPPRNHAGPDGPQDLADLTRQLGHLGQTVSEMNQWIVAYLAQRESQAAAHGEQFAGALGAELARLAEKLDALAVTKADPRAAATQAKPIPAPQDGKEFRNALQPLHDALGRLGTKLDDLARRTPAAEIFQTLQENNTALTSAIQTLQHQVEDGFHRLSELLQPEPEPEEAETPATGSSYWQQAILGPDLAADPKLAFHREQLLTGVLDGDPAACGLAGQLLVFQSAAPERLPQLLKDVGEAYYRWQPKTTPETNPVEDALVAWLHRRCEAAGIYNTIELVHPGQRYDAARHNASSRGVEISQVHGWIVLRDNGRVYMKASVSVR